MQFITGDAGAARRLVDQLGRLAATVTERTGDLAGTVTGLIAPGGWNSTASAAFAARWGRVQADAGTLAELLTRAADALAELATGLADLQAGALRLAAAAAADGFQIGADGTVRYARHAPVPRTDTVEERAGALLAESLDQAVRQAAWQRKASLLVQEADVLRGRTLRAFVDLRGRSRLLAPALRWQGPDWQGPGGGRPDRARVAAAVAALRDGPEQRAYQALLALDGPALDALIAAHPVEVATMLARSKWLGGLPAAQRDTLTEHLLRTASLASIDRLGLSRPGFGDVDAAGAGWAYRQAPAGEPYLRERGDLDTVSENDIAQGSLGDCWLLASLGALAHHDPDTIRQLIQPNPNGTYTVTLHEPDGPVRVTVTPEFPSDRTGYPVFAAPAEGDSLGHEQWPLIVEKAYAQYHGSYGDLEGGTPATALAELTGLDTDRESVRHLHTAADVQRRLDAGRVLVANTWDERSVEFLDAGHTITADHSYVVLGTHGDRVVLRNPWGDSGSAPAVLEVTMSDLHRYFSSIDSTPSPVG